MQKPNDRTEQRQNWLCETTQQTKKRINKQKMKIERSSYANQTKK